MWFNICTVVEDDFKNLPAILEGIKQNIIPHKKNTMWWIITKNAAGVKVVMETLAGTVGYAPPATFEIIGFPIVIMPANGDPRNTFLNACNHGYVYFCDADNYPHPFLLKDLKHQLYGPSYKVNCVSISDESFKPDEAYLGQYILSRYDIDAARFTLNDDFISLVRKGNNIVHFKESRSFYRKNS